MTEGIERGERTPFKMDTETIPDGVDIALAGQRTALIQGFRDGVIDAEDAMRSLLGLYWDTQSIASGETRIYLMASSYEFPVEAGLSMDIANAIWHEAMPNQ